jgi:hypothetical protein
MTSTVRDERNAFLVCASGRDQRVIIGERDDAPRSTLSRTSLQALRVDVDSLWSSRYASIDRALLCNLSRLSMLARKSTRVRSG